MPISQELKISVTVRQKVWYEIMMRRLPVEAMEQSWKEEKTIVDREADRVEYAS